MAIPRIPKPELPTKSETIEAAIEMYDHANELCRSLGIQATVALYDLPRNAFDRVHDMMDDTEDGFLVANDFRAPMWMKRYSDRVAVYTRQLPREQ